MDEDRWENIILVEITVLSRLNHPHAAPPPFVALFPITKLVADITCICMGPVPPSPVQLFLLWGGEGGKHWETSPMSMPKPIQLCWLWGPIKIQNSHGFHEVASDVGRANESDSYVIHQGSSTAQLLLHLGTPHPLAHFCGMRAKAMASRG